MKKKAQIAPLVAVDDLEGQNQQIWMVDRVETGNLSINTLEASLPETPFGGVKSSGYGREGGAEGLNHYTVVKNVSHSMSIV